MDEAVERVAKAIFNASVKSAGRQVLWTEDDSSWPADHTREEARQCARAAIVAVRDPLEAATRAENDKMRALLAYGSDPCIYCGLTKADMAKCKSGFPGCGRADDMTATDNPWQRK